MDKQKRLALASGGAVVIVLGLAGGRWLAAEAWTAGAIGFPLLLCLPGIWLLVRAAGRAATRVSLVALALALALLGLDVVDSTRDEVVVAGWSLAVSCVIAIVALAAGSRDPSSDTPLD